MAAILPSRMDGELLYLWIFLLLRLPSKFVKHVSRFSRGLTSRMLLGDHVVTYAATIICTYRAEWLPQIRRYKNSPLCVTVKMAAMPKALHSV